MFGKLTYRPHQLFVVEQCKTFDENGNFEGVTECERFISPCRCDDASVRDAITINGEQFFPSYHIVSEKGVKNGDFVRVKTEECKVRAEGKVVRSSYANYFNLYQVWI